MAIKKKSNGTFVRTIEKEVNADEILIEIQNKKRQIDSIKSQLEYFNKQLIEAEEKLVELTNDYKQLI